MQINPDEHPKQWYEGSVKYWDNQATTINGVLGGFGHVHDADLVTSQQLLKIFATRISGFDRAIDMGAGIGRVTHSLLMPNFKTVDVLEPSKVQLDKTRELYGTKISNYYNLGMQDFNFEHKYDCIWFQWVLMYLTDTDLVSVLKKSRDSLVEPSGTPVR